MERRKSCYTVCGLTVHLYAMLLLKNDHSLFEMIYILILVKAHKRYDCIFVFSVSDVCVGSVFSAE